jgi:NAD(P)-dependent dehydrogenase (short-subunit alcohol dehydrogenase family)
MVHWELGELLVSRVAARIFEARVRLRRHCPAEIARSVLFLASLDSSVMTGAALPVDGGMHV